MYRSYTPTCYIYMWFFFYTTLYDCILFYGPLVPEINYSILFYIARIKMKKLPLFVDVLKICRKYMIASILSSLELVAVLSDRWQHQMVLH